MIDMSPIAGQVVTWLDTFAGTMGGLAALLGVRSHLTSMSKPLRALVIAGLTAVAALLVGTGAHAISSIATRSAKSTEAAPRSAEPARSIPEQPLANEARATASPLPLPPAARTLSPTESPARPSPQNKRPPRISIVDAATGQPAADLIATIREALNADTGDVTGSMRTEVSQPDEQLQGLITTTLVLDVEIRGRSGNIERAFQLLARGGGFTATASTHQARERLRQQLHERLLITKEQPQ